MKYWRGALLFVPSVGRFGALQYVKPDHQRHTLGATTEGWPGR